MFVCLVVAMLVSHEKTPGSVTVFPPQAFFTFNLLLTQLKDITEEIKWQVCCVTLQQLDIKFLFYCLDSHEKTPGSVTVFPPQAFFTFNLLLTQLKNITEEIKWQVCCVTLQQLDIKFGLFI